MESSGEFCMGNWHNKIYIWKVCSGLYVENFVLREKDGRKGTNWEDIALSLVRDYGDLDQVIVEVKNSWIWDTFSRCCWYDWMWGVREWNYQFLRYATLRNACLTSTLGCWVGQYSICVWSWGEQDQCAWYWQIWCWTRSPLKEGYRWEQPKNSYWDIPT